MLAGDALGVELHPVDRQRAVAHRHDELAAGLVGPGSWNQGVGDRVVLDDQTVVAGGAEWRGDAREDIATGMSNGADLPVHRLGCADYLAAERLANRLVPEADAEQRDLACGRCNQIQADAGFRGRAGARRQHDRFGLHCDRIGDGQLVVAPHLALGADVAQKVKEVEGEAVVVVDEKDHGPQTLNARSTLVARSLLVERYLWSGGTRRSITAAEVTVFRAPALARCSEIATLSQQR